MTAGLVDHFVGKDVLIARGPGLIGSNLAIKLVTLGGKLNLVYYTYFKYEQ